MLRLFAVWNKVRARRTDRIGLDEVDRLVTDRCPDPLRYGLGPLLDAVTGPATAEELAGEQQAVATMVAARRAVLAANTVGRRHAKVPPNPRKVLLRLATGLAVMLVGLGAAAGTGSLPTALQQAAHDLLAPFGLPVPPAENERDDPPATAPTPTGPATGTPGPSTGAGPGPSGPVSPTPGRAETRTLCRAWNAAGRGRSGAGMDGPSWRALVAAAGGEARVSALCTALLGASSTGAGESTAGPNDSAGPNDPAGTGGVGQSAGTGSRSGGGQATPGSSGGGKRTGKP